MMPIADSTSGGIVRRSGFVAQAKSSSETDRITNETRRSFECETAYPKDTALILPSSSFILHPSSLILPLDLDPRSWLFWKRQADLSVGMEEWEALLQGDFRGNLCQIGIVGALRKVRKHEISCYAVKAVTNPFREILIR